MQKFEFKNCNVDPEIQVKALDKGQRTVTFYAARFATSTEEADSHGDIILKGAFTKTIQENRTRLKWLSQHDKNLLVGPVLDIYEDKIGLVCTTKASETDLGDDTLALEADRAYEHSIGFQVIKYYYEGDVRVITEVKLWEVSSVTWGSNPNTPTIAMKAMSAEEKADYLQEELSSLYEALDLKKLNADRVELLKLQVIQIKEAIQVSLIDTPLTETTEPEETTPEIQEPEISAEDLLSAFAKGYNNQ